MTKKNCYELELRRNGIVKKVKQETYNRNIYKKIKIKRSICWKCGFVLLLVSLIFHIVIASGLWFTNFYYDSIYKLVSFHQDGFIFDLWRSPPVPRVIAVYPFNYTNIDEVKRGLPPHVNQMGPYVFKEYGKKVNVVFHGNGTLSFQENRTQVIDLDETKGTMDDIIVLPNFPLLGAHNQEGSSRFELAGASFLKLFTFADDFHKVSIRDIIWGYDDTFVKLGKVFQSVLGKERTTAKFGILSERSGLSTNRITLGTGVPDLNNIAVITRYNGKSKIGAWSDTKCDTIKGSDGSLFSRSLLESRSPLSVFTKELCRNLPFYFEKEIMTEDGFPALRYRAPNDVFYYGPSHPENDCYCRNNVCPPNGTLNTAPCNFRLPVLLSFPHFTHADPELRKKVKGLTPDPEKYTHFIDIHPIGITVNGMSRMQANLLVKKSSNTPWLNYQDGTVLPLGWIEMRVGKLTDFLKSLLYHLSYTVPVVEKVLKYGSIIIILLKCVAIYFMLKTSKYKQINLH